MATSDKVQNKQTYKSFRIANQKILLTYKTQLNKKEFFSWAQEEFNTEMIYIAHETGDEDTPYEHTHVLIDFGKNYQTRNERRFDYNNIHPNIKTIRTKTHWKNACEYLQKEDTDEAYMPPTTEKTIAENTWNEENIQEALKKCTTYNQILPTIALWENRPSQQIEQEQPTWRPWQEEIIALMSYEDTERTIWWIYDITGGAGKSFLAKFFAIQGASWITYSGTMKDIMHMVANDIENGWNKKLMIIDLPRQMANKNIYEPIELIKNGLIQDTKYKGRRYIISSPTILVMANFEPNRNEMTADRWRIYQITNDNLTPRYNRVGLNIKKRPTLWELLQ